MELHYNRPARFSAMVGYEYISGNSRSQVQGETNRAFSPLYGTNHKFNGLMDYFYVGNHANSVGLIDLHASANIKLSDSSSFMIKGLNFSGEQELPSGETALGTEIDMVYKKKFKGYVLVAGYSFLMPSDGMYELKNVSEDIAASTQSWAWVMLVLKPKFLNTADL